MPRQRFGSRKTAIVQERMRHSPLLAERFVADTRFKLIAARSVVEFSGATEANKRAVVEAEKEFLFAVNILKKR